MAYNWSQSEEKWVATPVEEVLPVIEIDLPYCFAVAQQM
jgi:hypothetical protein